VFVNLFLYYNAIAIATAKPGEAYKVSVDVPLIVTASASRVPSISASPDISKLDASISPLALNITLSPPDTSKII